MTGAAFTPGPWRADLAGNGPKRDAEDRCELACLPHETMDAIEIFAKRREFYDFDEHKANAHLIAAAPELYEALETVDAMFSQPGRINKNAVRDKVRATLAKARGEQ